LEDAATISERTMARAPAALRSQDALMSIETVSIVSSGPDAAWVSAVLSGCRGAAERAGRALEVIVDASRGTASGRAWLYLVRDGALNLVAPLFGEEPPDDVVDALNALGDEHDAPDPFAPMKIDPAFCRVLLTIPRAARGSESRSASASTTDSKRGGRLLVGIALLTAEQARAPSTRLLEQLALELYEAGDVSAKTMSADPQSG
jgi:hypothetical protein